MDVEQILWHPQQTLPPTRLADAQLVLAFGPCTGDGADTYAALRRHYPAAQLMGCSGAGVVHGTCIDDHGISLTALRFARTRVELVTRALATAQEFECGRQLGLQLARPGLRNVLVLSDGLGVNGSALMAGLRASLPGEVPITGGLAGDADFCRTRVLANAPPQPGVVAATGFYGEHLHVGHGFRGGWDSFGPDRIITGSHANALHSLDDEPALELYRRYLGDAAAELPGSGLRFPFALSTAEGEVVRSVLAVDHDSGCMTCAGDMPLGAHVRLMKTSPERLVAGAGEAAAASLTGLEGAPAAVALLVSCIGRRRILGQRTEEELEEVAHVLGHTTPLCGFYSFGEFSPMLPGGGGELHNQTMTITTLQESVPD